MTKKVNLKELEKKIGYTFRDFHLLRQAMTHSSFSNEHHLDKLTCNERLEFLGDAVLEIATSEFLYLEYPKLPEGDLTKKRASIVCEPTLAYCGAAIGLGEYLLLGKGEDQTGGRGRSSIVSDAMEALIGAIYLDGGFASAKEFVGRFILTDVDKKELFYDSKTILQERVQGEMGEVLSYEIVEESGPDHDKTFVVNVRIKGETAGTGRGRTKKAAEQDAAYKALKKIQ